MASLNFFSTGFWKTLFAAALLLALGLVIHSCRKRMPPCTKNCVDITISGNVALKTSGVPLSNLAVELTWYQKYYCIICSSLKVAETTTSANGTFIFSKTIDSSLFNTYYLEVRVKYDTSKYIANRNDIVFLTNYIRRTFYNLNSLSAPAAQFDLYPKTKLVINFHRVLNDNFNYFFASHTFDALQYGDYVISGQQFAKDTTIHSITSADTYTKISWEKRIGTVTSSQYTDSIFCTLNGPNIFNINY